MIGSHSQNMIVRFLISMEITRKRIRKKAFVAEDLCVACGCCVKVCPTAAISVVFGAMAQADPDKCVGCGKCAKECPASVITIREVGA